MSLWWLQSSKTIHIMEIWPLLISLHWAELTQFQLLWVRKKSQWNHFHQIFKYFSWQNVHDIFDVEMLKFHFVLSQCGYVERRWVRRLETLQTGFASYDESFRLITRFWFWIWFWKRERKRNPSPFCTFKSLQRKKNEKNHHDKVADEFQAEQTEKKMKNFLM